MTYDEFKRQLGKAGVTAKDFANLVKLNPNSITNYAKKGVVPSHLAIIVALMGEMAENKINFKSVLQKIQVEPKRPRGSSTEGIFSSTKSEKG